MPTSLPMQERAIGREILKIEMDLLGMDPDSTEAKKLNLQKKILESKIADIKELMETEPTEPAEPAKPENAWTKAPSGSFPAIGLHAKAPAKAPPKGFPELGDSAKAPAKAPTEASAKGFPELGDSAEAPAEAPVEDASSTDGGFLCMKSGCVKPVGFAPDGTPYAVCAECVPDKSDTYYTVCIPTGDSDGVRRLKFVKTNWPLHHGFPGCPDCPEGRQRYYNAETEKFEELCPACHKQKMQAARNNSDVDRAKQRIKAHGGKPSLRY